MERVTLEYSNNNVVLTGILDAIAKMPDVKIIKVFSPAKTEDKKLSTAELYELAAELKASMNHDAPKMTMEEIVQEVRDYRNGL